MNRRSAMLVAAGLVATLVVGGIAVGVGLTGPEVGSARPRSRAVPSPIVKTTTRTVTVHRTGDASGATAATLTGSVSSGTSGSDDAYAEDESAEDDGFFDEDEAGEHEVGDDHGETEDHDGSGESGDD